MLILKSICLLSALYGYVCSAIPPKGSIDKSIHKDGKAVQEKKLFNTRVDRLPLIMAYIAIIETAIYLLLIIYGAKTSEYSNNYNSSYLTATLTQLQTVKPWHIIATIGAVLGYALRKWSFITLNEFFTFQLTIRPGHKLITHGPYKYLRHPSYTGGIINGICFCLLIFHKGLWSVMFAFILDQIKSSWLNTTTFGTRILYLSSSLLRGEWLVTLITIVMVRAILERIANEEKMMKNHFGKEWYTYANKRWSLVPFVY